MSARNYTLRSKYGITHAQYDVMLAAQRGGCAICGGQQQVAGRSLAVDHCHKTGAVRGLLCNMCNQALGAFGDDSARLRVALAYLEKCKS